MEDAVSRSSLESSSTGDEYVVVNGEPKLKITGDINDINEEIFAGQHTDKMTMSTLAAVEAMAATDQARQEAGDHVIPSSQSENMISSHFPEGDESKVRGRSTSLPAAPHGDYTVFNGVTYLGCATVNAPRSEVEIYRNMAILNEQSKMAIPIALSVPSTSDGIVKPDGLVRLLEPNMESEIASYRVHRILFCARGPSESNEKRCFAFTCSHGNSADSAIFQCHVFRCELPEAVAKILYSFANSFRRVSKGTRSTSASSVSEQEQTAIFVVSLEFKEDDGKGNFSSCPKDKNVFKFRCNNERKILVSVGQTGPTELKIERCFGLLVSPGRNVKHGDMHLIEMNSMGYTGESKVYGISGAWDPTEQCFMVLNTETPKDTRVFLTVAVDLVIHGIQEPVRFAVETKAKIYPQNERFWYFTKKPHQEQFHVRLRMTESENPEDGIYEVISVQSQTEIDRKKAGMSLQGLGTNRHIPEDITTPQDPDEESDGDEPLLSGSGVVSKEITDENLLEAWHDVLVKWHQNVSQRPKNIHHLVRKGIPEALRGEVWQLLAGCTDNSELLEAYRVLITKESTHENVITRDLNRTFPAHDFFKETGGLGQDSLYKLSKAYSVYDEELGYVQGLSFLAAALLLHMPEEQAFAVLVKMCFDYGVRDLFKQGFEVLHLKFYQLERLMEDQLSDLYEHFVEMNIETHMFASQWFLTLFTAKFPLHLVFHILDVFFCEGSTVIFNVALALLKLSRKDLLALDFEGILKYFRVQLPKKYRSEDASKDLIQAAINCKVTSRKLKKYEKEYIAMKEQEIQQEDPVERVERENKRLLEANMRLEQENDDLAHELVESKLSLRSELDVYQDRCEDLNGELLKSRKMLVETQEEKQRLETESHQVKEMCRRELEKAEAENARNIAIIADYKDIRSRLEKQKSTAKEELNRIRVQVKSCDNCSKMFDAEGNVNLPDPKYNQENLNPTVVEMQRQVRELELELAQTKLALVEAECKTQDLTHQLNSAVTEIQASKNTWFHKTLNSIKEVTTTNKKEPKE